MPIPSSCAKNSYQDKRKRAHVSMNKTFRSKPNGTQIHNRAGKYHTTETDPAKWTNTEAGNNHPSTTSNGSGLPDKHNVEDLNNQTKPVPLDRNTVTPDSTTLLEVGGKPGNGMLDKPSAPTSPNTNNRSLTKPNNKTGLLIEPSIPPTSSSVQGAAHPSPPDLMTAVVSPQSVATTSTVTGTFHPPYSTFPNSSYYSSSGVVVPPIYPPHLALTMQRNQPLSVVPPQSDASSMLPSYWTEDGELRSSHLHSQYLPHQFAQLNLGNTAGAGGGPAGHMSLNVDCALGVPVFQTPATTSLSQTSYQTISQDQSTSSISGMQTGLSSATIKECPSEADPSTVSTSSIPYPVITGPHPTETYSAIPVDLSIPQSQYYPVSCQGEDACAGCSGLSSPPSANSTNVAPVSLEPHPQYQQHQFWPASASNYYSTAYLLPQQYGAAAAAAAYQTYQPLPVGPLSTSSPSFVGYNTGAVGLSGAVPSTSEQQPQQNIYRMPTNSEQMLSDYYQSVTANPTYTNSLRIPHASTRSVTPVNQAAFIQQQQYQLWLLNMMANYSRASYNQLTPLQTNTSYAAGGTSAGLASDGNSQTRRSVLSNANTRALQYSMGFDMAELSRLRLRVNPTELDESLMYQTRYFVIKSDSEYNVHQSIRLGVWCSTKVGNQYLDDAYRSTVLRYPSDMGAGSAYANVRERSSVPIDSAVTRRFGHVLLFYSIRSTRHLSGVAEMIGPVDHQKRANHWQDCRFRGEFPVRWLYIKNIPNDYFENILIENYDNRPVTVLRDTSEILPSSKGEAMLRIVHNYGLPTPTAAVPPSS